MLKMHTLCMTANSRHHLTSDCCICGCDLDPIQGQCQGHRAFELPKTAHNCTFLGLSPPPLSRACQNWWLVVIVWDLVYSLTEVGHAGSTTGIMHADMTLTQAKVKVKVTGLLNFQKLVRPCMLAAMTVSPLAGLSGLALQRSTVQSLLWPPYVIGGHYIFALWFLSIYLLSIYLLSFFSSPNLSGHRSDVYYTSTHGMALVRI